MTKEKPVIIAVDDIYANRFLIKEALDDDYRVIGIANGTDLQTTLEHNTVALIILDIMMPEQNGFEIAKQLQAHSDYKNIPIIFLTAKNTREDVIDGMRLGADDFITKPFDPLGLKHHVKNVFLKKDVELIRNLLIQNQLLETQLKRPGLFRVTMTDCDFFRKQAVLLLIKRYTSQKEEITDLAHGFSPVVLAAKTSRPIAEDLENRFLEAGGEVIIKEIFILRTSEEQKADLLLPEIKKILDKNNALLEKEVVTSL